MQDGLRYPPAGVETAPASTNIVLLREAARRLNRDHRTVRAAIIKGHIRGGAQPQPHRLRWYVYEDQLPPANAAPPAPRTPLAAASRAPSEEITPAIAATLADQAAKIVALEHNNRILTAAVDDVLDAFEHYKVGTDSYRDAAQHFKAAADGMAASLKKHRDALAQYTTPGHLGDLDAPPSGGDRG